ncbi:MAG: hypothetical protein LBI28_11270, partial [Treponema sp.]|nr:hypothetical protein [Treponema sp.]
MGAIAIITTVLFILLVIGAFGLIIGIVFLLLAKLLFKTKKKLFIILPVIGIILSLIPFIGSLIGISHFRSIINESQELKPTIDTGVKIYWKYENRYKDNEDEYFVYNNKKYIYLTGYLDRRPDGIEIDSPVANIIRKEENVISKIFIFIFNVK